MNHSFLRRKHVKRQPHPQPRPRSQHQLVMGSQSSLADTLCGVDDMQSLRHDSNSSVDVRTAWELKNHDTRDSTDTLTDGNYPSETLNSFDRELAKTPLYSSDTRLMEFMNSTSTMASDVDGEHHYQPLTYPRNRLHQSDTRLLQPSQIELKSTNYFTRPPLSCSSLEEEQESEYGDYLYTPPSGYSNELGSASQSSTVSSNGSSRPKTRRSRIHISGQSLQSPDGSYFSIESDEDDDFVLYENIAALKLGSQMMSSSNDCTQMQHDDLATPSLNSRLSLTRGGESSSEQGSQADSSHDSTPTNSTTNLASHFTTDAKYGNHSQIFYHGSSVASKSAERGDDPETPRTARTHARPGDRLHPGATRYPVMGNKASRSILSSTNNNVHHISNGSSAYGSGSLAVSRESDIDTYL